MCARACLCVCIRERDKEKKLTCIHAYTHVYSEHRSEAVGVQLGANLLHVILLIAECNPFIVMPPEYVHIKQRKVKLIYY